MLSYRGVGSIVQMASVDDVFTGLVSLPRATNCCSTFSCLPSFFGGIFVLALVEIVCVVYFVSRLLARKPRHPSSTSSLEYTSKETGSISFSLQGNLWVAPLPEGDWSKAVLQKPGKDKKKEKEAEKDGSSKEGSKRGEATTKDVLEIAPVWKHVMLKEGALVLEGADGIEERISLEGCEVFSVSSGATPGGKWAKRYPIKLHHSTRTVYRDCKDCLFYAESGYEKEAWCEVLRATARANDWCSRLKHEFRDYTNGAETHVPYLSSFHSTREANHFINARKDEKSDDNKNNSEENISKKRLFLNKLLRRNNSKGKNSNNTRSPNAIEELGNFTRRISSLHPQGQNEGSSRKGKEESPVISDDTEDSKNGSRESASSDSDGEKSAHGKESDEVIPAGLMHGQENEKGVEKEIDQGLLCLNMLVGRLFFDFYHSQTRVAWVQNHFQKLISKIKTPSYIKSITIKELDLGKDPPFATALRMLPADAAGALAMEVDFEWYGGGFITIETRVDVRDQIAQEKVASQMAEPGSAGAAAAAILSGIGEDLETADASGALMEARQAAVTKKGGAGDDSSRKGGWINSVRTMISRVAVQVSQVPLLLKIRLVSVKGTCIISLRAPPSDRIWFSFKEMPNIDLAPEPCIGDHRISSGPLGSFIANQIKVQVRESIVTPYCQDLFLHWMLAEEDDWVPQSAIPVAFSAVTNPETDRPQTSKHNNNPDVQQQQQQQQQQLKQQPVEENENKSGQQQSLPLTRQVSEPHGLTTGSSSGPSTTTQMPPPSAPPSQSQFAAESSLEHSFASSRPLGASVQSSAPASIREDCESDLMTPLLDDDDYSRDIKLLHSSSDLDVGASARASERDLLPQSEGSALQSEGSQNPSNQLQVGNNNQEHPKADVSKESESSVSSRRTKMLSLGKKGITKLEERRRIVLEKLREKRAEAGEGGSSRGHSGHFSTG